MTMTLIETKTLGTAQAAIEFTSIPQDGTDLVAIMSMRLNVAAVSADLIARFNGDTGNNYAFRRLVGRVTSVDSDTGSGGNDLFLVGVQAGNTSTANTFGNGTLYIPNYTSSNAKTASVDSVSETNGTVSEQSLIASRWTGTAAITSILFRPYFSENILAGSTISLYKITKGSSGGVVVS
jgi:hypothetical protein